MFLGLSPAAQRRYSSTPPDSGDPDWKPEGSVSFLDMTAGNYYAGGAVRTIDEVLSGYDASAISSQGMYFVFDNANRPVFKGPLLSDLVTALAAGVRIEFELDFVNEPFGWIMFLGDVGNWNDSERSIVVASDDNMYDENSLGIGTNLTTTGPHTLSITLNEDVGGGDYKYTWILDGGTPETQTVSYSAFTLGYAALGWDGVDTSQLLDNVWLKKLTIYPVAD